MEPATGNGQLPADDVEERYNLNGQADLPETASPPAYKNVARRNAPASAQACACWKKSNVWQQAPYHPLLRRRCRRRFDLWGAVVGSQASGQTVLLPRFTMKQNELCRLSYP